MKTSDRSHSEGLWPATPECRWSTALENLSAEELDAVHARLARRHYDAHSCIYNAGDKPDAFFIVESGRIRMFWSRPSGDRFTLALWSAGYTVGLFSTLLDKERPVTVEAVEESVLLALPRKDLLALMETIPTLSMNLARLAASMASEVLTIASVRALDPAVARLGNVLANVATREAGDDAAPGLAVRGLSQEDLASMVGVSRTWLTLMLSKLEVNGLIKRKRMEILIHDIESLQRFCQAWKSDR